MIVYHSTNIKELKKILVTGYLRPPIYVTTEEDEHFGLKDLTLTLDVTGFKLYKDPHPWAKKGFYFIKRAIDSNRIIEVEFETLHGKDKVFPEGQPLSKNRFPLVQVTEAFKNIPDDQPERPSNIPPYIKQEYHE